MKEFVRQIETKAGTVRIGDTLYWRFGHVECVVICFYEQSADSEYPAGTPLICCRYLDRNGAIQYVSARAEEFDKETVTRVPLA